MLKRTLIALLFVISALILVPQSATKVYAMDEEFDCYKIYDSENSENLIFMKGDAVKLNDEYISADNKLYIIEEVDEETKTGKARYKENVKMPVYNITKKNKQEVSAETKKKIGLYHTHNDECYDDADGTDSIYGKGGIHDIGAELKNRFEQLGMEVYYSESLHLPHNSGAYTRSQATASSLLENGLSAVFDIHRDATPRSEYYTTVDGIEMSKVRMVVGSANAQSAMNKEFALSIKAYADQVYPGLIKDIYFGSGNYNQQLSSRAMLFEMGTNTIEKELVMRSCVPLSKTIDVVLFGTNQASTESLDDVDVSASSGDNLVSGLTDNSKKSTSAENTTLWVILGAIGAIVVFFLLFYIFDKKSRASINRFFSELTAGIFGKKRNDIQQ